MTGDDSMARGRKGMSAEEREAKGNPGRRSDPKPAAAEVPLPPVQTATPKQLSAEAKKIWARAAPHLQRMSFFRATDTEVLARWCENLKRWWDCERELRKRGVGMTYETASKHGKMLRIHPLVMVQNALERRLIVAEDRLGLSPRARQEILRGLATSPSDLPLPHPPEKSAPADGELALGQTSPLGLLNRGSNAIN
jgi:P27 family predicted phage terminase small subunit